ncbi:MAG: agmatine deiminase family protein, partial [Verrucomicrobiales bacterium]
MMATVTERRRLPAEWETHQGTLLSWPNRRGDSFRGEILDRVIPTFLEIARAIATSETLFINVSDEAEKKFITTEIGRELCENVEFYAIPTNEPWCRDHGPLIVEKNG